MHKLPVKADYNKLYICYNVYHKFNELDQLDFVCFLTSQCYKSGHFAVCNCTALTCSGMQYKAAANFYLRKKAAVLYCIMYNKAVEISSRQWQAVAGSGRQWQAVAGSGRQ